jgi:predicted alpha/beta-hydrolase family hydrolase
MTEPKQLSVSMNDGTSVTALLYLADKKTRIGVTVILGHGAGAGQLHPFMRLFASGLAERGFDAFTFNFQYMEQGRKVPDPTKLENCYRAVIEAARTNKKLAGHRLVIGGKSMGGRIASQVAALECGGLAPLSNDSNKSTRTSKASVTTSNDSDIVGLVFLGYPLHPPGRPDKVRDAHLPQIKSPMLFVQGSRDAFGSPDELRATIKNHHLPATLHIVAAGDHSLKVPKSLGMSQDEVYASTMDAISAWTHKLAS